MPKCGVPKKAAKKPKVAKKRRRGNSTKKVSRKGSKSSNVFEVHRKPPSKGEALGPSPAMAKSGAEPPVHMEKTKKLSKTATFDIVN